MKIACTVENFASYTMLDVADESKGLVLIHGATGSGKSTFCDAIPWVLFGKTAKGGTSDEILNWTSLETAKGVCKIDLGSKSLTITRSRGRNQKNNDLFWIDSNDIIHRGKDLSDTQKLINTELGMNFDLYLSGAYFHEFSQTAQFFTATAKSRRAICEQIVDLTLAKSLQENITIKIKNLVQLDLTAQTKINELESGVEMLSTMLTTEENNFKTWSFNQNRRRLELQRKQQTFNSDIEFRKQELKKSRARITVLPESWYIDKMLQLKSEPAPQLIPCNTCGALKYNEVRVLILNEIAKLEREKLENELKISKLSDLEHQIKQLDSETNIYEEQIKSLDKESNPYISILESINTKMAVKKDALNLTKVKKTSIVAELTDLQILLDLTYTFRVSLMQSVILSLETKTNELLYKHFDSEIKIQLIPIDSDKIDVEITKDGNLCSYTQLSKGQRQLLKLCFGVSVMAIISEHHGIQFAQIFLDEALDGLDETLKIKAFGLLEELSTKHETVYVVEHNQELKTMFSTKYKVTSNNGNSEIEEA